MKKLTITLASPLWYTICALLLIAGENNTAAQIQKQLAEQDTEG